MQRSNLHCALRRNALATLRSFSLALFAIVAIGFSGEMAAQSLAVKPASQLSVVGAPVVLEVQFTPGAQPISGFTFNVTYQVGTMSFVTVSRGAATIASNSQVSGSVTTPGTVAVTCTGTSAIGAGVVARIEATALGTGNPFPPVPVGMNSVSATLVAGGTTSPTLAGNTLTYIDRCDVDSSLGIDVVDVQLVVNMILSITTPLFANHGDCNGDSTVDVVDVQLIVNNILNPNQPLSILTQTVPNVTHASPYSFTFAAVGGAQPYTWTETGQGIPGLTLSSAGVLTGSATQAGQYTYSVRVTDANNAIDTETFTVNVTQVLLQSVVITPSPIIMDHNATVQLTATGTYSDSTTADVTSQLNWTSNALSVATVGFTTGLLTGAGPGTAAVTCTHPTLTSVTASVNVTVNKVYVSLSVTPGTPSIVRLLTQAFTATANFSDSTTENVTSVATWVSSSSTVAGISMLGVATGQTAGTTTITASRTINGVTRTANTTLTVTQEVLSAITVAPSPATGFVGSTLQFTASGTFNNGTQSSNVNSQVTWSSSNPGFATINSTSGLAFLSNAGTSVITATRIGGGASGTSNLTVNAVVLTSISVTPATPSIQAPATQQFTASGVFSDNSSSPNVNSQVTWSSSNTAVATINSSGLATGVGAGTTTITATRVGGGVSGNATLTVTAAPSGVSFSTQVLPLLNSYGCAGCHAFINYSGVRARVSTPPNPATSTIYLRVSGTTAGQRMPQGGPFMNATELQLFSDWITQGALNN